MENGYFLENISLIYVLFPFLYVLLAIDLIKHLLQVQRRRRLTVDRAMLHDYFKVLIEIGSFGIKLIRKVFLELP